MLINDKTLKIIDTILKNEIGLSCEELSFLDSTAQEEILVQRYNPTKKIRHFRLGEKVILDDGTYMIRIVNNAATIDWCYVDINTGTAELETYK